jgi:hypothetical protein
MAEGFAVDLIFGFVLLVVSAVTESFSVAFFLTMGGCIAAWLGWHLFKHYFQVIAEMAQQLTELLLSNIFGRAGPPGAEAGRIPPRLLTSNVAAKAQIGQKRSSTVSIPCP